MIEMRLDVTCIDPRGRDGVTQPVTAFGVSITILAEEHSCDPEALAKLYALALVVHASPLPALGSGFARA